MHLMPLVSRADSARSYFLQSRPPCPMFVTLVVTGRAGALLLSGLFFYDIFWVFGTPVMVSVAKSLDAPIKLLFPRPDAAAG